MQEKKIKRFHQMKGKSFHILMTTMMYLNALDTFVKDQYSHLKYPNISIKQQICENVNLVCHLSCNSTTVPRCSLPSKLICYSKLIMVYYKHDWQLKTELHM